MSTEGDYVLWRMVVRYVVGGVLVLAGMLTTCEMHQTHVAGKAGDAFLACVIGSNHPNESVMFKTCEGLLP
jgi:hypothetical protein